MGGISIWQLLIILVIVLIIFGTKKFRNIGSDLGRAVKGFKKSIKDDDYNNNIDTNVIDNESITEDQKKQNNV